MRISVGHFLRGCAGLALNESARKFDPVAARAGDFERIEKKVVGGDLAVSGDLEKGVGFSVLAGEQNVHHARAGAASEESLNGRRHDLGLGFAGFVGGDESPEAIDDDAHCIANLRQFFFALDSTRHVKFAVETDEFKSGLGKLAIVAHGHHEIETVRADAFPLVVGDAIAQPLAGDFRPDLILHPWLLLVADPAGFAGKDEGGLAIERDENVDVTMGDFESGGIKDSAFESRILIAAYDESVEVLPLHPGADVFVAAVNFVLTWQYDLGG